MFKPLRPLLGPEEDQKREALRKIAERVQRRSTNFEDIPWAPVRPGESHAMIENIMSQTDYGIILEALNARLLDQDIEGDEYAYELRKLAARFEEDQRRAHEEDKYWGRG